MRNDKQLRASGLLGLTILTLSLSAAGFSRGGAPGSRTRQMEQSQPAKVLLQMPAAETPEKIIPAFKNIKEQTATYVFLGWIWVCIFVLIYILWNKIKEVDRLFEAKFFDSHLPPDVL